MIKIEKLHKSYLIGKDSLHVLKGIDLHIKEGEFVSIMGSSGSGKSTLLNIVGLLDVHDEGNYYLNGQVIKDMNEKKAAILRNKFLGFVFQSFNLISYKRGVHIRLNSQLKKVWRLALVSALSQNSLARSLARTTIEDYYADRKVTLRALYYDMTR